MTWWGSSFEPNFNIDSLRADLEIVNIGISKAAKYKDDAVEADANHRIIFSYWNDMCRYIDTYQQESTGFFLEVGLLSEINLNNMSHGQPDNIIYQIDDTSKTYNNGDFWFKLYPNKLHLYGPAHSTNLLSNDDSERSQIAVEQTFAADNPPNYYAAERQAAQQKEIASIIIQRTNLQAVIDDCNDGLSDYPQLQGTIDTCNAIIQRCDIAQANAQAEIDNTSLPSSPARISYLTARLLELASDSVLIDASGSSGGFVRDERYGITDLATNVEYGSSSGIIGYDETMARLNAKKTTLEDTIERYEHFE